MSYRNTIFHGSAAQMADLPDASVDLIFTSPPYEARKVYHTADGDIGRLRGDEFIAALKPIMRSVTGYSSQAVTSFELSRTVLRWSF